MLCRYEAISWATLVSTSTADRLSSSTDFSTPCSNRANTRAGVPVASRISTGRSGLCFLIVGYFERMNCRVPADAEPVWEQRMRISLITGEKAFENDILTMSEY